LAAVQGGVAITKSIIIDGSSATLVGQIVINSPSATVIVRGLALDGAGTVANGIRIDSAAAVHIEDCTIERYSGDGIKLVATTATKLFVSNTVVHANGSDGLYADDLNAQVLIQNSQFEGNFSTGVYLKVAKAKVTRSDASGNGQNGIILTTWPDILSASAITETSADNNSGDGIILRGSGSSVSLTATKARGNGTAGLHVEEGKAHISDCEFYGDYIGHPGIRNDALVGSFKNNKVWGGETNFPAESLY
jgi:hypothetical protein